MDGEDEKTQGILLQAIANVYSRVDSMMERNDNRIKEYLKWRERVVKSLPNIANRVFALRHQLYSGCGFHYSLERQLGIAISNVQNVSQEAFESIQMILTKLAVTQLYKKVAKIEREIKIMPMETYPVVIRKISQKKVAIEAEEVNLDTPFYNKVFISGKIQLTRRELEELPCSLCTKNVGDSVMQNIVQEAECEVNEWNYNDNNAELEFKFEDIRFREIENAAVLHKIPYYDELHPQTVPS